MTVRCKPPEGSTYKYRRKAGIVGDYRQQLPAGGDRLGSGSRGLASFGFAVRPGPALPPVEDPPPAPSLPGTGQSEINLW